MKISVFTKASVLALAMAVSSQALADGPRLLRGRQFAIYHTCLYDSWIHDWCQTHDVAYQQCVISYRGGRYAQEGHLFSDDYCYGVAKGLQPR
jgi:hypothetical protein